MNICMFSRQHSTHAGAGGLGIAAGHTAQAAHDASHEVVFVTTQRSDGFSGESQHGGVQLHWLPIATNHADGVPRYWELIKELLPKLHAKHKFDLVHSQSGAAASLVGATGGPNVLTQMGLPCIMQDHGLGPAELQDMLNVEAFHRTGTKAFPKSVHQFMDSLYLSNFRGLIEPDMMYMRRYKKILATSSVSKWDLMTRYGLTNVELFLHCIYGVNGVARAASPMPVVLFFAANLDHPYKSAMSGLTALVPIKDKITIKLIGKGPKAAEFAKANFPRVDVLGFIPEQQAIKELGTSDILVECSLHHRGLNLTGITAIGMGVPVVAYPTGGHADMVGEDSDAGMLVDPFKPAELRDAVLWIAEARARYSARAIERFKRLFSPEIAGKRLSQIYEAAIG